MSPAPANLIDRLPVSVACLGPDLRFTWANARLCQQLDRADGDVVGRTCQELGMGAESWGDWSRAASEVLATGRPVDDYHLCDHRGAERLIHTKFGPLPGPDGRPAGVVAVLFVDDVVKRLRDALSLSERRFHAFMDHMPAAVWVRDADQRYLFVNREYVRQTHINVTDRVGRHIREVYPPEVADRLMANDDLAVAGPVRVAEQIPDGNGVMHPRLSVKFTLPGPDGRPQYAGFGLDMTDEKRREDERREMDAKLLRAQKAEALGVMAGGAAHDFNNILAAVLGYAALGRQLAHDASLRVQDCFAQIEAAAERAADLCRQMLAFAGDGRAVEQPVDLSELARETVRLLAASHLKGVTVTTALADPLPSVLGDPTQLRQVVLNLLTNAAEATAAGGVREVTVTTDTVTDPAGVELPPGVYARLAVTDTGSGMDADTAARVFDPFFTTKKTGRGIGLAALSGIVRGHHGAVRLTTAPAAGSTFEVLLPVAPRP